jgi:hypothetical protein
MYRLTVHIENAPFIKKERKVVGKDDSGKDVYKPKKSDCIVNTITIKGLSSRKEAESKLSDIRKKYTIAKKQKSGGALKVGAELVYISIQ